MGSSVPDQVTAPIGYASPATVVADEERPGLLRSPTIPRSTAYDDGGVVFSPCTIRNLDAVDDPPGFVEAGFEAVRLPDDPDLLALLAEVRDTGTVDDDQARRLRSGLTGATLDLADGSCLRIDHVADEGVIVRQAGPDGVEVEGAAHQGAVNVHIDQDVQGTPLRQIFAGGATEVFGHDSPDSHNHTSSQYLVNLWLPLHQITRPLTLMDGRTLDRPHHQLRYGLPVTSFLDRDQDQAVNDIWLCLHHPDQAWWFRPEAGIGDAYVFDTLSTAHAAVVLPGEDVAADRYRRLGAVATAVRDGDPATARAVAAEPGPPDTTAGALHEAVAAMDRLLVEAAEGTALDPAWVDRAEVARTGVVRMSLELRAGATRLPADD